jgi:hypothetical protein
MKLASALVLIFAPFLMIAPALGKDKTYPDTVTAVKDGTVTEVASFNRFTNVVRFSNGDTVTLGCSARAVWTHCYQLTAGMTYPARSDNHGHLWVQVNMDSVLHRNTPWTKAQPQSETQKLPSGPTEFRSEIFQWP